MTTHQAPFTALASVYDAIMGEIEYDGWAEFTLTFLRSEGFTPRNVLDLACGTGNSTRPFVEAGLQVTGLDLSRDMLTVAQKKLPDVTFVQGSLTDFQVPGQFDLITCMFDSINNLLTHEDMLACMERVRGHLTDDGWFVADVNTRIGLRDLWEGGVIEGVVPAEDGQDVHYHWSHHYDEERELGMIQAFFRMEDGSEFIEQHTERGYDPRELGELLEKAGFRDITICEYPDYAAPDEDTPRVWLFARVKEATRG
ncbi:class I SAM-dependent DNA methyltransferase [Deinococcus cellulosilyticus]|uniref:Methyltransferase type 11 n=1 Tax=Deinococcus cellulosilyticus (strain DSM 18568 / NBRC 106333 / KACC 11606 / 5516J-15) TaxID=1223518 RepID=A0A511N3E0_DEIC1|nr:class I SAM-dependent methyltransferase [Deinococcus cellulosilyticus]GEM46968.1 methyltransferase type 11 [Deinococcus cellulosilyticus NBRC 106333 = KACC 11606]